MDLRTNTYKSVNVFTDKVLLNKGRNLRKRTRPCIYVMSYYQQRPADMGGMRAEFDFRTYIGTLRGLSERQNRGKTTVIV